MIKGVIKQCDAEKLLNKIEYACLFERDKENKFKAYEIKECILYGDPIYKDSYEYLCNILTKDDKVIFKDLLSSIKNKITESCNNSVDIHLGEIK